MIEEIRPSIVQAALPSHDSTSYDSTNSSAMTEEVKSKKHKGMLPASGSLPKLQKEESISKEKVIALLQQAKAAVEKSGFDPRVKNILMLYIAFAQSQMDQNDKLEAGWMDQQHVQNLLLEDSAKEQKKIANESTTGKHFSGFKALIYGLIAVFVVAALVGLAIVTGGAAIPLEIGFGAGLAASLGTGAGVAAIGVGVPSLVASSNPNAGGVGGLTENGPDQNKLTQIGILNAFWNLIAQKANQNIQTGTQLNIVNASSSNTQQGQQAAQVIQEWGEMSRFQLAR